MHSILSKFTQFRFRKHVPNFSFLNLSSYTKCLVYLNSYENIGVNGTREIVFSMYFRKEVLIISFFF